MTHTSRLCHIMSLNSELRLSDEETRDAVRAVREELARRRITRGQLAELARISLSTLEKALSGKRPLTLSTAVRLEEALGLVLRRKNGEAAGMLSGPLGLAPESLGSYARPAVSWIEGSYLTIRPSFGDRGSVYAYETEVYWDVVSSSLLFREARRIDAAFTQCGSVSLPQQSGHIYLVTNMHGQYRLIIVARPTIGGEMHGILTTLQSGRGPHLTAVSTPIALVPMRGVREPKFGRIAAGHESYTAYRALLKRTLDEGFAMFLPGT